MEPKPKKPKKKKPLKKMGGGKVKYRSTRAGGKVKIEGNDIQSKLFID